MNVIVVEDEISASKNMLAILKEIDSSINVLACLESIEDAIEWITKNPSPDLAFMDIQLSDGISFDIFETVTVDFPVVFTTAFNQYALQAFKLNSIDYILKPIKKSDVSFAINKYNKLIGSKSTTLEKDFLEMMKAFKADNATSYKSTLLIKKQNGFVPVLVEDLAYFYLENGIVLAISNNNEKYVVDEKLDEIQMHISPKDFFRANRQCIVSKKAIVKANTYFNGRLLLKLNPESKNEFLISKAKVRFFKKWLEK